MNGTIALSNRIAAGVTAAYVLDLTRRPAPTRRDRRREPMMRLRVPAGRVGRERDGCGERRGRRTAAAR